MPVYTGDKFYNPRADEYFTVIGVQDDDGQPIALLQYQCGMPSTEPVAMLEDRFHKLAKKYVDTEEQPTVEMCCHDEHRFDETTADGIPVCSDCHLSAPVIDELLDDAIATAHYCAFCGSHVKSSERRSEYAACTIVCDDCWNEYET